MLRDLPIQRKILVSIVGTVTIVLVMIETIFVLYNWFSVRETVQKNLLAVAEVFSLNTTAAMSFSDSQAAEEILSSLRGMPEIHRACLYQGETKQAQLFASYVRGSDAKDCAAGANPGFHSSDPYPNTHIVMLLALFPLPL